MRKTLVSILVAGLAAAAAAAQPASWLVQTCTGCFSCANDWRWLSAEERARVQRLVDLVQPGSTEAQIQARTEHAPWHRAAPVQAQAQPLGVMMRKAAWPLDGGEELEVMFVGERAAMFTWYSATTDAGEGKSAAVYFLR